jgi:RNA polymerase sigma-70 factor (ECF subfamily)
MADDDASLLVATGRGDRRAFATLFDRHQAGVVRFCARFVKSQAQAEEAAQEVFVKLFKSASRYRPDAQFKTFLFRVATNHCLNEVRRQTNRHEQSEHQAPGHDDDERPTAVELHTSGDSPQLDLEAKELEAAVAKAMDRLSERERAAFTMCRFEGMAYRDIAAALEASEAAVKSLIHRATLSVLKQVESFQAGQVPAGSAA